MFKKKLSELDNSLERVFKRKFAQKSLSLRTVLLDSPKQYSDVFQHWDLTRLRLRTRKLTQKIGLAVMSWYMNDEIRVLTQLALQETWGADSKEVKDIVLTSKEFALTWLIVQDRWTERDFFGNVLDDRLARLWSATNFYRVSQRPVKKYTGYCRGYQESNRLRKEHLPAELQLKYLSPDEIYIRRLQQEQKYQNLLERVLRYLETDCLVS